MLPEPQQHVQGSSLARCTLVRFNRSSPDWTVVTVTIVPGTTDCVARAPSQPAGKRRSLFLYADRRFTRVKLCAGR